MKTTTMRLNYYSILGYFIVAFLFFGISNDAAAQIKIGTNGSTIAPSSILELESNNQGLLLPRLTDTVAINTLNPPNGMLIYLTKWPAVGLYVRKATGWEFLTGSLGGNGTFNNLTVGGTLTAQNFTGNLIGNASTSTLATTATNALNVNITNDLSTSTVAYPTFVTNTPGSQSIRTGSTNLSYVPNTGILTAKGFKGNLVGDVTGVATSSIDAINASKIQIVEDDVNNNPVYPTFVTGKVGPLTATINSAKLQYLPATGELTAPIFKGDLQGNATTTTTATNAANVAVSDDSANSLPTYPVFVNALTGNQALKSTSTFLSYVPSTGILTAKGFVGNLVGDVSGQASSALNANSANNAVNAVNAANSAITDDNSSVGKFYPTFVGATSGNQALISSSSNLSYVPSTGTLTAKSFVGNLVGDVTGKISNAQQADNASNLEVGEVVPGVPTYYPALVSATTGQTAIKVNNSQLQYLPSAGELISPKFRGELIGNASSTTTAENASKVAITDDITNNLPNYPVFVNTPTGKQEVKSSSTKLSYVPSTGILTATGFVGNLVGNVTGQVSNAQNAENTSKINVATNDISAGTVYPVFVSALTGSLQPNVSTNRLGFKPLTGELSATTFKGDLIGNSTTATSATTATNSINSGVTDDNSTNSTFFPVFVGTASGNQAIKASSNSLKYNPSNGILTSTGFAGPLVGNVTGQATTALSATSATNVAVSSNDLEPLTMFPTFVSGVSGSLPISVHSTKLGFKPAIGELSATIFKGDLAGNASNATSAVTADNALKSVIIDDASHSAETYPLFVNNAAGNQPLRTNRTNLSYVPSTGTLKAKEFIGDLTGSLDGTATNSIDATNAANVSITDDLTSNSFMPLTFVDGNSGNLPVKVSSTNLKYNPSTGVLIAPTFLGVFDGNAKTATTISPTGLVLPVNGGTGFTSYAPGDILYAESSNTLKKLSIGPIGSVLRVQQVGASIVPSWATTGPGTITEVQYGGTGKTTFTVGSILVGNGTSAFNEVLPDQAGKVLTSNGPGLPPSYKDAGVGDMILNVAQTVTGPKTFGTPGTLGGPVGKKDVLILSGYTSGTTILNGPDTGIGGTVVLPQRGTLATLDESETLTKKTLIAPTLTSPKIGDAVGASLVLNSGQILTTTNQTGSGSIVMSNDAQLVSPNIGNAMGSSLNVGGGTITAGTFVGTLNGDISGNANNVSGVVQIANGGTGANTKQAGFDNLSPMTSPGDMIYGETLGSAKRLPLGGANQVLKGGTIAPAWGFVKLTSDVEGVLPTQNGGTGNAFTEFTGPFTTKKIFTLPNFDANIAITSGPQTFTGTQKFTSTIDGNIASANTATKLAATKNINNVPFDGSVDITVTADASTLTGTTLNSTVLNSSLTSVGTLTNLTVTNPIDGNITGNAATATTASTVTTNANLTGEVTSVGNTTTVTNSAVISKVLTGFSSVAGVVAPTDNIVTAISKLSGNINANANATHTGDVTGATDLTISNNAVTTSKIANSAITLEKIEDVATNTVLGRITAGTGVLEEISTVGTGNVVRAISPTLVTPILGAATATSLTVTNTIVGSVTGTADNVTGTVSIANGGTGATTQQGALNALVGTQSIGKFLRSDGTNTSLSNIQVGDVPTLNQNTTGTAAGLTDAYIDWNATSGGAFIKNKPNIVTSVAATVPSFLTITGSPITSSGVLNIDYKSGVALPVANGGTGLTSLSNGGALYSTSTTALTSGTLPTTAGGTGYSTYTIGDILYASSSTALGKLSSVADGNALISNGVGVAPTWGKIDLAKHVQGVIPASIGGTGSTFAKFVVNSGVVREYTLPTTDATLARIDGNQTFTGTQTFSDAIVGNITGNAATVTTNANLIGDVISLNSNTTTIAAGAVTFSKMQNIGTGKILGRASAGTGLIEEISTTGSDEVVRANTPTLVTPILGTATATSINKVAITQPTNSATLTLANNSTLATSGANSITLTSTGPTNVTLPTTGILVSAISASGTLNFNTVNAGESASLTINVTGAADGDAVSLGVPSSLAGAGGIYTAWVSAPDTVTVKFSNTTAEAIDPASATFKIKVLK